MRTHLHDAIAKKDAQKLIQVVDWFETELVKKPDLKLFEDVINGYIALDMVKKRCETIDKSLLYYPANKILQELNKDCLALS